MSKEEILQAIRSCARKLKHNPSRRELRITTGIADEALHKHFGGLTRAMELAGLRPSGRGFRQQKSTVLLDWAVVARKLGKIPTLAEYQSRGLFSAMPFRAGYGNWTNVPNAFQRFAREQKIQGKWKDVLKLIAAGPKVSQENGGRQRQPSGTGLELRKPVTRRGRVLDGLPIYGAPMHLPEMAHEPLNELGVIFAFGVLARRLGFVALRFQPGFPDCEALREVARGVWQRVRIEFEFESRNFLRHRHKPNGCELIVCWKHNWKECPKGLEVIELRKVLHRMIGTLGEPGN